MSIHGQSQRQKVTERNTAKIWFDVLTPKQLLFAEPFLKLLEADGHSVFVTTRHSRELDALTKIRMIRTIPIGSYTDSDKFGKLHQSVIRTQKLTTLIHDAEPDVAVSFISPDAARVSFGLGIRHVAFTDSPHATHVMKLSIPLLHKLLTPSIIPKTAFTQYGISQEDIIQYNAIDAAIISNHTMPSLQDKHYIIIRPPETWASYADPDYSKVDHIISEIQSTHPDYPLAVLPRYAEHVKHFRDTFPKLKILQPADSMEILSRCLLLIGSGGTLTAQAALAGKPVISYNHRDDYLVDAYLARKGLLIREHDPLKIPKLIQKAINNILVKQKAHDLVSTMEMPYAKLKTALFT